MPLALPPERARGHAEISSALTDEVRWIGQADAQPNPADADAIETGFAQHPARDRHPAIVEQPAERQAGIVETAMQCPLGNAQLLGDGSRRQPRFGVAEPDGATDLVQKFCGVALLGD